MTAKKHKRITPCLQSSLLVFLGKEARIDSRLLAKELVIEHKATLQLISKFKADFEEFGQLPFEMNMVNRAQGGGHPEKYVLLNESQAYLLLTYSKNTNVARLLKKKLIKEFEKLRKQAEKRADVGWKQVRASSALGSRIMQNMLRDTRAIIGKETQAHHYQNEARLINWALTGEFCALEREQLSTEELALLEKLEYQNTLMLGRGIAYAARKEFLSSFALHARIERSLALAVAGQGA